MRRSHKAETVVRVHPSAHEFGSIAQLVQQRLPYKQKVAGSNPAAPTKKYKHHKSEGWPRPAGCYFSLS